MIYIFNYASPFGNIRLTSDGEFLTNARTEFWQGRADNRDYTLAALKRAHEAGASALVLCDTNGGSLPEEIAAIPEDKDLAEFLYKRTYGAKK